MQFNIQELNQKLDKSLISGRLLLSQMRVINEFSRLTSAYSDPAYVPFYFYLGQTTTPVTLLEIGFNLGMLSGCFLKGCSNVERFLAFQPKKEGYYNPRLGKANIKDIYKKEFSIHVGQIYDSAFMEKISPYSWDLTILNEEVTEDMHMTYLEFIWPYVSPGGLIVMDYLKSHKPARDAFNSFCESKRIEPVNFATRYGTGIIQKENK